MYIKAKPPNNSGRKKGRQGPAVTKLVPPKNIVSACRGAAVRFDLGKLKLPEKGSGNPVIFFPAKGGYIPGPAKLEGRSLTAQVPAGATEGFVIMATGAGADGLAQMKDTIQPAVMKKGLCVRRDAKLLKTGKGIFRAVILGYLSLNCPSCAIICPTGALIPDPDGDCRVDPARCIGHTFITDRTSFYTTADGRQVFNKLSESQCWNCFNGSEDISTRCNLRRLRKVAYNSGVCCGNCSAYSRVTGLNLMELCPSGAITHASGTTGPFVIDADLCTGCLTCFNNIVCLNNISSNTTLKMVAHADLDTARLFITITKIVLVPPPKSSPFLPATAYLLLKSDLDENSLKLTFRPGLPVGISPAHNNTGLGRQLSLAVTLGRPPFPQLGIPGPEGPRFPLPVTSALIPPFCHNGSLSLAGGRVKIYYDIHE